MTKTPETATVIRNKNDEVIAVIITQLKQRTHVFYKTEKMGVEEIADLIRDEDKPFGKTTEIPKEIKLRINGEEE